jgi:hypothetical protein
MHIPVYLVFQSHVNVHLEIKLNAVSLKICQGTVQEPSLQYVKYIIILTLKVVNSRFKYQELCIL